MLLIWINVQHLPSECEIHIKKKFNLSFSMILNVVHNNFPMDLIYTKIIIIIIFEFNVHINVFLNQLNWLNQRHQQRIMLYKTWTFFIAINCISYFNRSGSHSIYSCSLLQWTRLLWFSFFSYFWMEIGPIE